MTASEATVVGSLSEAEEMMPGAIRARRALHTRAKLLTGGRSATARRAPSAKWQNPAIRLSSQTSPRGTGISRLEPFLDDRRPYDSETLARKPARMLRGGRSRHCGSRSVARGTRRPDLRPQGDLA